MYKRFPESDIPFSQPMMKVALISVVVPKRRICSAAQDMYIKKEISRINRGIKNTKKAWVKMGTSNGVTVSVHEGENGDEGEG